MKDLEIPASSKCFETPAEAKNKFLRPLLPPAIFIFVSFLLYIPVIGHYFVSDDFKVLGRVCLDHILFIKRFFRPLSDISILINYQWGGLNPVVFNSFNILIHGINAYLVWLTCLSFSHSQHYPARIRFATISAVIFLTYPFHNEAVVWMLGRGASLACLFVLLAIISFYRIEKRNLKIWCVCLCYFISLSAFESTILFPLIFILLLIYERRNTRSVLNWFFALLLTAGLHLLLRYQVAGSILGSYGRDFFHSGLKNYILNIGKVSGRLIFPPTANSGLLILLFFLLIVFILFFAIRIRLSKKPGPVLSSFLFLAGLLFISCIVPIMTGISTKTSETDRVLYFPSVFLSMLIGIVLVFLIKKQSLKWIALCLILVYNIFFLEKNNLNWRNASRITSLIMEKIQDEKTDGKVYVLNIPKEIKGAYVFRQGFPDALRLYGKDSTHFIAVHYLTGLDMEKISERINPDPDQEKIILPGGIILELAPDGCRSLFEDGVFRFTTRPGDRIYFWNMDRLDTIQACKTRKPG
jgi:protein O-mannosyl-transferase